MNYELNTSMEKTSHETNSDEKDNKDEFGDRTISIEESVVNSKILHGCKFKLSLS